MAKLGGGLGAGLGGGIGGPPEQKKPQV